MTLEAVLQSTIPQKHMYDLGKKKRYVVFHCCVWWQKKDKLVQCGKEEEGGGEKRNIKNWWVAVIKAKQQLQHSHFWLSPWLNVFVT